MKDQTKQFDRAAKDVASRINKLLAETRPVIAARHFWPQRTDIDRSLVIGSVLFGIGWGLVGLCPGPALENLSSLSPRVFVFVMAMIAGMSVLDLWQRRAHPP